jgi:hypothetical protein
MIDDASRAIGSTMVRTSLNTVKHGLLGDRGTDPQFTTA